MTILVVIRTSIGMSVNIIVVSCKTRKKWYQWQTTHDKGTMDSIVPR
jgi:hypothetical protein